MTNEATSETNTTHNPRQRRGLSAGIVFILTGLVGSFASFFLLYERVQLWMNPDHVTACDVNPWVSCGTVMESWQASTFGFPNIFIGVVAFPLLVFAGVALMLAGKRLAESRIWWTGILTGALFAFGFISWLWYNAVFVIGVLCPYCMIVWAAVIPFFCYTIQYIVSEDVFRTGIDYRIRNATRSWWWVFMTFIYIGTIASIVLLFPHAFAL